MKEWNIGDKVKIVDYDAIPAYRRAKVAGRNPRLWSSSKARLAGTVGKVVDKLYSEAYDVFVYKLQIDSFDKVSAALFIGDDLEELPKPKTESGLRFTVEIHEDVVVARLMDGDVQLGIGHGHVLYEGAMGIMQAGSYAMKKCYMSMGGTFPKKGVVQNG